MKGLLGARLNCDLTVLVLVLLFLVFSLLGEGGSKNSCAPTVLFRAEIRV